MKKILIVLVLILSSCGTYQLQQTDKCCDTEVIYLEDIKSETTIFSTLDFKTITLDFRPRFYRSTIDDWYWGHNYSYWGHRPLWMDFGFYNGYSNYYSYHHPYYSYRPWNSWDWYMRPWRPYQHNQWSWYNGPFNNQGYNVVWNSSRRNNNIAYINGPRGNRNNIISNNIENRIVSNNNKPRVVVNKPVVNKPVVNNRPVWNNNKPVINSNKPVIRNNNRPTYNNSRPTYNNSRPTINNNSRPSNNSKSTTVIRSRGGKNN